MKDANLAFPLLAELDFLRASGAILELAQNKHGQETEGGYMYYPFYNAQMTPCLSCLVDIISMSTLSAGETSLHPATVSLYYALPPTWKIPLTSPQPLDAPVWDSDNQEELLKLMAAWPRAASDILGKTDSFCQMKCPLNLDLTVFPLSRGRSLRNTWTRCSKTTSSSTLFPHGHHQSSWSLNRMEHTE